MPFANIYKGKKVLVTGHTGFKGSWLTAWLLQLGADIVGISCDIPTNPSHFEALNLENKIKHYEQDIEKKDSLIKVIVDEKPDFVFHLAAQAIVSKSFYGPIQTLMTNVIGTAHVLEGIRLLKNKCVSVMITSDKCYENVEWCFGYKETDALGGKDIYSASKASAENIIHAYFDTYLNKLSNIRLASVRAGNVIGGGDWAKDRIVVDAVLAWIQNKPVQIRSPEATRPWQHVLEPLSGYLNLGMNLWNSEKLNGEAFNFGPRAEQNRTVLELLSDMARKWGFSSDFKPYEVTDQKLFNEAGLLKLNCDKALFHLKWQSCLNYDQTVSFVADWYKQFYKNEKSQDIFSTTQKQIAEYSELANKIKIPWATV